MLYHVRASFKHIYAMSSEMNKHYNYVDGIINRPIKVYKHMQKEN